MSMPDKIFTRDTRGSCKLRVLSPDADVSGESAEIQALANALWTDEIKSAYADSIAEPEGE